MDTGSQRRALFTPDGGVTAIFSGKVGDYVRARPGYPAALLDALHIQCHLHAGAHVADVGAGTGLLTQGLLAQGYRVTSVEPNAAMRAACDHALAGHPAYRSIDSTAEAMALDSGSVDLITAAQAFHWFDIARARTEFLRVLKPTGQVALVWNDRVLHDPLHLALDEVFARFGGVKRGALLAHEERMEVPAFFGSATSVEHRWPHVHHLDAQGLRSLVFSRSYMPAQGSEAARQATVLVDALFERFAVGAQVAVPYTTLAIVGRPG